MISLASCHEQGKGVTASESEAIKWYRAAAAKSADAEAKLGAVLLRSRALVDAGEALLHLKHAAEQGSAVGQFHYAQCFLRGVGTERDERQAFLWFEKAAKQNDALAMYNFAVLLEHGQGCVKNVAAAIEWYRKAAACGGAARASIQMALLEKTDSAGGVAGVLQKWGSDAAPLFRAIIDTRRLTGPFQLLNDGNYGQAVRCWLAPITAGEAKREVVVKSPKVKELTAGLFNEWLALSQIPPHPNVHAFLGVCEGFKFQDSDGKAVMRDFSFVTDFEANGSIEDYIGKHGAVSHDLLLRWALDIARGLAHLHSLGLVHRDLAARNVLLKADLRAVVADFGLLRRVDDAKGPVVYVQRSRDATALEQAPECLVAKEFSDASDMFSWALTLFESYRLPSHGVSVQ